MWCNVSGLGLGLLVYTRYVQSTPERKGVGVVVQASRSHTSLYIEKQDQQLQQVV